MNEKHDVENIILDEAEGLVGKNKKKMIPIILMTVIIACLNAQIMVYFGKGNSNSAVILMAIFSFVVYPLTGLGVANYAIKLVKGSGGSFKDILTFYKLRVKDAFILSFFVTVIFNLSKCIDILRYFNLLGDSVIFEISVLICLIFVSIKLVLVPFLFVEKIGDGAIDTIIKSWKLSNGRGMDIVNIYLKIFFSTLIFAIPVLVIGFALSFAFPFLPLLTTLGTLLFVGFINIYQNLAFADFALRVFSEEGLLNEKNHEDETIGPVFLKKN